MCLNIYNDNFNSEIRMSVISQSTDCLRSHWAKTWLDDRLLYLAVFLSDAAVAALRECIALCDTEDAANV